MDACPSSTGRKSWSEHLLLDQGVGEHGLARAVQAEAWSSPNNTQAGSRVALAAMCSVSTTPPMPRWRPGGFAASLLTRGASAEWSGVAPMGGPKRPAG